VVAKVGFRTGDLFPPAGCIATNLETDGRGVLRFYNQRTTHDHSHNLGTLWRRLALPVLNDDTVESLSARILEQEHRLYSEAIRIVLSGKFHIEGRRVVLEP
jgi:hypothetical protein